MKLDLFHAIQRITSVVKKKDAPAPVRQAFFKQLRLAFRDSRDRGDSRTMNTPNPGEIRSNIERIIGDPKWRQCIPEKAFSELKSLLTHVDRECLR